MKAQCFLVLLLLFVSTGIFGQPLKMVKKHKTSKGGLISYVEVYQVLKSNKKIRHGSYERLHSSNRIITKGYYKNGLKDSLWVVNDLSGQKKTAEGYYSKGAKVGVWTYYDYNGLLELKYNHTDSIVKYVNLELLNDKEFIILTSEGDKAVKLDRPPIYLDGSYFLLEYIIYGMYYPVDDKRRGISGKVIVSFVIDENGKTSKYKLVQKIGGQSDKVALNLIKSLPDNWIPAVLNGEKAKVRYEMPVNFRLN